MSQQRMIYAKFTEIGYQGGKFMCARVTISEGPTNIVGRNVNVSMSFDDVKRIYEQMEHAARLNQQDEERVSKINSQYVEE